MSATSDRPGPPTILVVDDVPMLRDVAKTILENEGFKVITATNGQECVDLHKAGGDSIALTILDFAMPRLNGHETLLELQKLNPDVRVMLSSGSIEPEVAEEMLKAGLSSVLPKPYSRKALLDAVQSAIGTQRSSE